MNRSQSAGRCAVALSLLLALTAGCSSLTADAELRLEVFDTYADALARDYPFFPQKHVDWESLTHSYRSAVVAAEGPGEFYHLLVGLLAELDDAHVSLAIPAANWGGVGASTTTVLDLPGFEVAWLERRLHVTAWPDGQAPVTPEHLPPELGGFPQITKVQGARVTVPLVDEMFRGPAGSVVELQLAWADGTLTRHTLRRPSPRSRQRVEATGGVRRGTVVIGRSVGDDAMSRIASLEHRGRFAWLRLNSFVPPPGEDGDARFTAHVDALLTEAAERDGLVLDLRDNSGGRRALMAAVMGRFLDRPFELVLELEVLSWLGGLFENRRFWALVTEPVPPRIERPVVILTSWHTGSAAERLARVLQQVAGAIVIGEQTIGAEAGLVTVAGGDGTTLKFGAQRALETNGVGFQDEGITPDIAVRLTLDDLRRCGSYRAAFGDWERRVERAAELRLGRMVAEVPAASDG